MKANEWNIYIGQDVQIEGVGRLTLSHATDAGTGTCLFFTNGDGYVADDRCKVVLRSLDEMTEEKKEFSKLFLDGDSLDNISVENNYVTILSGSYSYSDADIQMVDWLTQKGFSIRQEFERGVAVKEVGR